LLAYGDKGIEIVYNTVRKKIFCTGPTRAAKAEQKYLVLLPTRQGHEPTKEGPLSFVFFESPFSVSTVSRGHPSLVSLGETSACRINKREE
jgi:hypothetical protein